MNGGCRPSVVGWQSWLDRPTDLPPNLAELVIGLVFVRLAHDRRFVGAVLFLFFFVLVVFIRISGRHRVAQDHEGTPVDEPAGKFLGDVWGHVVAPRVWTLGDYTPLCSGFRMRVSAAPFAGHASDGPPAAATRGPLWVIRVSAVMSVVYPIYTP